MPTTRIQEKLSTLVRQQLPEFIQADYGTFVAFLQYYYEFLEQDQGAQEIIQNARSYADIDTTAASFIQYFIKQYGKKIPVEVLANKPLLIKNLTQLYEAKGSSLSFDILFRILFNTDVSVKYPYENVLRASSGTWEQLVSLRVETVSGDRLKITNHLLEYNKDGNTYSIPVIRSSKLTETLSEVFIQPSAQPVIQNLFESGDEVLVKEQGVEVFRGTIKLTTTGYDIVAGGTGFKIGQIFNVSYGGAVNTLVKVLKVGSSGEITKLGFVNYGYNFTTPLTISFTANSTTGTLATEPYSASEAVISFSLGAIGRYPGQFTTNYGFVSEEENKLEDDKLYQPFAYQTNTDVDISSFYGIVKSLIHPAGQQLYNNRNLNNFINVYALISVISNSKLFEELASVLHALDASFFTLSRPVSDTFTTPDDDIYTLIKVLVDVLTTSDDTTFNISPVYSDIASVTESISRIDKDILLYSYDRYFFDVYTEEQNYAGDAVSYEPVYTVDEISVVVI